MSNIGPARFIHSVACVRAISAHADCRSSKAARATAQLTRNICSAAAPSSKYGPNYVCGCSLPKHSTCSRARASVVYGMWTQKPHKFASDARSMMAYTHAERVALMALAHGTRTMCNELYVCANTAARRVECRCVCMCVCLCVEMPAWPPTLRISTLCILYMLNPVLYEWYASNIKAIISYGRVCEQITHQHQQRSGPDVSPSATLLLRGHRGS